LCGLLDKFFGDVHIRFTTGVEIAFCLIQNFFHAQLLIFLFDGREFVR
jgi:hypothetical protein